MGKKHNATAVTNGAGRGRLAWAWSLLAVATAICVSVGACVLLLPDRAPALLGSAGETTTAPASVQEYSGSQQVTVVPTISTERNLLGNANGTVTADWSADGLISGKGAYKVNDRVVVALNTATPLYRDLKTGDKGDDVLALNNELSRLGYNSVAGHHRFHGDGRYGNRKNTGSIDETHREKRHGGRTGSHHKHVWRQWNIAGR